ncbi:MAG: lactonase family protein [Verrucomicrobiota bacterium]
MAGLQHLAVVLAGTAVAGLGAGAQPGQIVQLTGPGACVSQLVTDGICAEARALNGPDALTVSPDGRTVYAASFGVAPHVSGNTGSIAVLTRNRTTGRIRQPDGAAGCVGDLEDGCGEARGIEGTSAVATSADGRYVYATGFVSGSVASFARAAAGSLTQLPSSDGCVGGGISEGCAAGPGLRGAAGVAISPDGTNLYVASFASGAVAAFARDTRTGRIRQLAGDAACIAEQDDEGAEDDDGVAVESCRPGKGLIGSTEVAVSPDGKNVYVLARDSIAVFRRGSGGGLTQLPAAQGCLNLDGSGGCTAVPQLENGLDLAIGPDGRTLYVASYLPGSIALLRRDPDTGALAPLTTLASPGLDGVAGLTVTPDGDGLYAVSPYQDAVLAFRRKADGRLERLRGAAACVSDVERTDACAHGQVLSRASAAAVSPDGRHLYVSSVEPIGISCACGRELGSLSVFTRSAASVSLAAPRTAAAVRAGTAFRITAAVQTTARPVTVVCSASVGGRSIHARGGYTAGAAVCTGFVPRGAAGTRLAGMVRVTAAGAARTASFSFPIRQAAQRATAPTVAGRGPMK